jgi:hypothetical protein
VRRDLTHAEVMAAWRVDAELYGHTPSQTIGFVNALADVEDAEAQRRASPVVLVLAGEARG